MATTSGIRAVVSSPRHRSPGKAALNTEPLHEYGAIYSSNPAISYRVQLGYIGNGHFSCQIKSNPSPVVGPGFESVQVYWDMTNALCSKPPGGHGPRLRLANPRSLAQPTPTIWRFGALALRSRAAETVLLCSWQVPQLPAIQRVGRDYGGSCVTVEIPSRQLVSTEWMVSGIRSLDPRSAPSEVRASIGRGARTRNIRIDRSQRFAHNVEAVLVDNQHPLHRKGRKARPRPGRTSEGGARSTWSAISDPHRCQRLH